LGFLQVVIYYVQTFSINCNYVLYNWFEQLLVHSPSEK
jgi:hypothetical protein